MKNRSILQTTTLLFALSLLVVSLIRVSAVPLSPYIMVVPEKTLDSTLTPGSTYTISIYTNYAEDSDVWAWQFGLTYNPAVLSGTGVINGNLITTDKDPSAIFMAGTFDNTVGRLSPTGAYFDPTYYDPPVYATTSGPGTLAYVSFDVIGYGSSGIELVDRETKLVGAIGSVTYNIIDGLIDYENIGHGFFSNKLIGDVNSDSQVDVWDLHELGKAYASNSTEPNYNSDCDFNHDFEVNDTDLSGLCNNYGESI